MKGDHLPQASGHQVLQAFAMAHVITETTGGDALDVTRAALRSLPRDQVVRMRDGAAVLLAAADQVLGEST